MPVQTGNTQDQNTFVYRVCNQSAEVAFVTLVMLTAPGSSNLILRGWWAMEVGECAGLAVVPRPGLFFYAETAITNGKQVVWRGDDVELCVDYPGPFERVPGGDTCGPERMKGFKKILVPSEIGTLTTNLR
jgi:uncharacterized membrane protein